MPREFALNVPIKILRRTLSHIHPCWERAPRQSSYSDRTKKTRSPSPALVSLLSQVFQQSSEHSQAPKFSPQSRETSQTSLDLRDERLVTFESPQKQHSSYSSASLSLFSEGNASSEKLQANFPLHFWQTDGGSCARDGTSV